MRVVDRFRLDDKVAVVTGASSGLGVAISRVLGDAGAQVVVGARRVQRIRETVKMVEEVGAEAVGVELDVTDPGSCSRLVEAALDAFGHVDVLVNNAGMGTAVPAMREEPAQFRVVLETNLMGQYWMAQACARKMRPGSSIINIGSVLGFTTMGLPQAAYCSSKAALVGLTSDLAQQWSGRRGIRVNLVAAGIFATEMTDNWPPGYRDDAIQRRVPLGRIGELDELAAAVLFLASDAASYITGAVLAVDGGLLVT